MCAIVTLKERENKLRAIVAAIRMKGLRERWRHAQQNAHRYNNCDKITLPHEYPRTLEGTVARETTGWEERPVSALCQ
jgi:hypothetical protein